MLVISVSLIEADVVNLTRGIKGFPVTPDKQIQCEKRAVPDIANVLNYKCYTQH